MKAVRTRRAPSHARVRAVAILATALVAVLALTGCARNPDVAVRLGELSVTNEDVRATAAPFVTSLESQGYTDITGLVEQDVVWLEAVRELARRYAQEQGITVPPADYSGIDAGDPYQRLQAEAYGYLNALHAAATPRTPTEEELRSIYDRLVELVGEDRAGTYEQIRDQLLDFPQFQQWLTVRDQLMDAADRYGLTVNPRYQPLEIVLFDAVERQRVMVALPLGEQGTGAAAPAN